MSPGVPNDECIVAYAYHTVNLSQYILLLGVRPGEIAEPIPDYMMWLSDITVDPKTWIYIYTGTGNPRFTKTLGTEEPAYVLYWNKNQVLFKEDNIVPMLVQIGTLDIGTKREKPALLEDSLNKGK